MTQTSYYTVIQFQGAYTLRSEKGVVVGRINNFYDAKVFAAAPDMVCALEEIRDYCYENNGLGKIAAMAVDAIRKVEDYKS